MGLMRFCVFVSFLVLSKALNQWSDWTSTGDCVAPGQCTPPTKKYSKVIVGPSPGQQWNINGGFCGAWSTQQGALAFGAWISQGLVRRANRDQPGVEHNMHGNPIEGYEVMPVNVGYTSRALRLNQEEWDYNQPKPQAAAFKQWLKEHLAAGHPISWFPLCKGDPHQCYKGSCPNGGQVDHVEPIFGLFSDHPLTDSTVYPDDYILHASDQDMEPYYRPFSTLEDKLSMQGNCAKAQPGFGKNEMYPCFDEDVTYGNAITGLNVTGILPLSLVVDMKTEPDGRRGQPSQPVTGEVSVSGLTPGQKFTIYRYNSTEALPFGPPFDTSPYESKTTLTASSSTMNYKDPKTFPSNSATYYIATSN